MIVKSIPRKDAGFDQLLRYINLPARKGRALLHNLEAGDLPGIHWQFFSNAQRLPKRRNGNILYHEILSFHGDDRLTPAAIEDLVQVYLDLRAPYALAYARPHYDTSNPHVHVLISANEAGSNKRLRLARKEFAQIKERVEEYQRERYPELQRSIVHSAEKKKERLRGRKQELRERVGEVLERSATFVDFVTGLAEARFSFYVRGQTPGVVDERDGKRYRLKTIALAESFAGHLSRWKALAQLSKVLDRGSVDRDLRTDLRLLLSLSADDHPDLQALNRRLLESRRSYRRQDRGRPAR